MAGENEKNGGDPAADGTHIHVHVDGAKAGKATRAKGRKDGSASTSLSHSMSGSGSKSASKSGSASRKDGSGSSSSMDESEVRDYAGDIAKAIEKAMDVDGVPKECREILEGAYEVCSEMAEQMKAGKYPHQMVMEGESQASGSKSGSTSKGESSYDYSASSSSYSGSKSAAGGGKGLGSTVRRRATVLVGHLVSGDCQRHVPVDGLRQLRDMSDDAYQAAKKDARRRTVKKYKQRRRGL